MVSGFYDLNNLTEEEMEVYRSPENFQTLLWSPWIHLIKDQEEEGDGELAGASKKGLEADETLDRLARNLQARNIVKEIYKLYVEAPGEEQPIIQKQPAESQPKQDQEREAFLQGLRL